MANEKRTIKGKVNSFSQGVSETNFQNQDSLYRYIEVDGVKYGDVMLDVQ